MDVSEVQHRHRRGDPSPAGDGLVFLRYARGREVWVTPEKLLAAKTLAKQINARQRAKPGYREKMTAYLREYQRRPEQVKKHAERFQKNKERDRAKRNAEARRYQKTPKARQYQKQLREKYRDRIKARRRIRQAKIRSTPEGRLRHNYATRIAIACRQQGTVKSTRTIKLLGCTAQFFRGWLEAHFEPGMTWANYGNHAGTWQVDHVFPIASFDLSVPEQMSKAFHYTNCKPMWTTMNHAKSDALPDGTRARDNRIIPFKAA